jgi:hypothetical protein
MEKCVSRDGTKIAYDHSGSGSALVLVTGRSVIGRSARRSLRR